MADKELTSGSVRHRYRDLEPGANVLEDNRAYAEYTSAAPVTPLGHQEYAVGASVVPLASVPSEARRMHLRAIGATIYWTDVAGDTPSTAHGFPIMDGEWLLYDSVPTTDFKMISSGVADVRIAYYG